MEEEENARQKAQETLLEEKSDNLNS